MKTPAYVLVLALAVLGSSTIRAEEPSMTKGQFCAYLAHNKAQKQHFMLWLTERLTQTEANDALTERALTTEKQLAKEAISYYDNLLAATQCDSATGWSSRLVEEHI
jgi:hypothetical protein